jgi:hypothetical protein
MTTVSYHDFSAAVIDYNGQPLEIPNQNKQLTKLATYANFAVTALRGTYEDETLTMEAKLYRSSLCDRILKNPTSVDLSFADRAILCNLVSKGTRSLLIAERFFEFLGRTDIVVTEQPVISPIKEPLVTGQTESQDTLVSTDAVIGNPEPVLS